MNVYDYIKNFVNVRLEPSKIQGVGVFALRDIDINEKLFVEWDGETGEYFLSQEEFDTLDSDIKNHVLNMYGYKKINNQYMLSVILVKNCHWIFKSPLHWVNSCAWDEQPNFEKETLKTIRKIKKGEEILLKYGKYDKFKRTRTI